MCAQQMGIHQADSKPTQHHGSMVCTTKGFGNKYGIKYGGTLEIQCAYVSDAPR